jgi:NTE family protein
MGLTDLDYPSKLDRSSDLIEELLENGRDLAPKFFERVSLWPREGSLPTKAALL